MQDGFRAPVADFDTRRDGIALVLLLLGAVAIQLPIFDRWLSLLDEGAIVQIADQITRGQLPYRDGIHVAFPGVFYVTAGLFELFGTSLVVVRVFMVAVFTAFVGIFYLLARSVAGTGTAFCCGLLAISYRVWAFPHFQMINYASLAVLPLMIAVAILAHDIARPKRSGLLLAGAMVGLAFVFKQDLAGMALAVLTLFVWFDGAGEHGGWRAGLVRATGFALAGTAVPLAVVAAFVPAGLAGELLHQTIWYPLVAQPYWTATAFGGHYAGFPPLWPPFEQNDVIRGAGLFSYFPALLLNLHLEDFLRSDLYLETALPEVFVRVVYTFPYALLAILIAREIVRSRRGRVAPGAPPGASVRERRLRLLIAFGIAALVSFNRPRDWIHLLILYPPTLLLLGPVAELLAGVAPGLRRRGVGVAGAAGAGIALVASFSVALTVRDRYAVPLDAPRAGLFVAAEDAAVLNPLLAEIMPAPGSDPVPLAAFPAQPVLNFLSGRPLATRFLVMLPNQEYSDRNEQVVRDLRRDPRTEIVYAFRHNPFSPLPQEFIPGVFAELTAHHQLGSGPKEIFSGPHANGALFAKLVPRPESSDTVLFDFARHLDRATLSRPQGSTSATAGETPPESLRRIEAWPFEDPVISIAPRVIPEAQSLSWEVAPETDARLRFGVAMNPDRWASFFSRSLRYRVRVDGRIVFETSLDPFRNSEDRRWVRADVPVPRGPHTIEFEVAVDSPHSVELGLAGFARPRLVEDTTPARE